MKFVGEIGIPRREYLYDLQYLDLLQIERGHDRRHRHEWAISRWQTYRLMEAFIGTEGMNKSGLYKPIDLFKFPWEKEDDTSEGNLPDAAEIARMQQEMREYNEQHAPEDLNPLTYGKGTG